MKNTLLLLFVFILFCSFTSGKGDTIYAHFYETLEKRDYYTQLKEARITEVKRLLATPDITNGQRYDINHQLNNEYKTFMLDSAIYYVRENLAIAEQMKDKNRVMEATMALSALYAVAGLHLEAIEGMRQVNKDELPDWMLQNYYSTYNKLYFYYSSLSDIAGDDYRMKEHLYRDSLLSVLDPESNYYKIVYAEKLSDNQQLGQAKALLKEMLEKSEDENHERAVLAYALSNIYKKEGDVGQRKKYLVISTTSDIKNAIKENASLQALASVLYEEGEIAKAYKCIQASLEDAMFSNARLRTFEVARIFPIIDTAYQESLIKQKKELTISLIVISVLVLFLLIAVFYVYKQMKRVARIRKELYHTNVRLNELNTDLHSTNEKLSLVNEELSQVNSELLDANQLKETYISRFLDLCSMYINKLEKYQRTLNKKAVEKKLDELYKILKSNEMIEKELKELYENFDQVFLHLYPNFIRDFNALLVEDTQFDINATELNTELRIFALIRLGITDSARIANFLHYSATTIYNYRTRMRNKAAVPREDFEFLVRRIGILK